MEIKEIIKQENKEELKRPFLYEVMLLNDDYTTMDFVIEVLMDVFQKSRQDASLIMLDVHLKGKGTVGVYSYDIASTKVLKVEELARKNGFPLKADMYKVEQ
jgi:ATP-dependent Clp protease adaptor protein ClpS